MNKNPNPIHNSFTAPLVSVLMPSYNHENYVREAIISVANQSYPNIELIIIDDGSKDNTAQIIDQTLLELKEKIKVIFIKQENFGICKTLNRALSLSSGEFIQFLASDDVYLPEKTLLSVKAILEASKEVGAVYSDGYIIDEKSQKRAIFSTFYPVPISQNIYRELLVANWIPAMGILYRREILDKLGGFDENLKFEDWDLLLRFSKIKKIIRIPEYLFLYRQHSTNISKNTSFMQNGLTAISKKHPDVLSYLQLKIGLRKKSLFLVIKNIHQIDLIFRYLSRKIFTNRGIQGVSFLKSLKILSNLIFSKFISRCHALLIRARGITIGSNCKVTGNIKIRGLNKNLEIGKNVIFEGDASFILPKGSYTGHIKIGNNCVIANGAIFQCMAGKLALGDNCYIGHNVLLQSNGDLQVGNWTLIAANSGIYASNHVTSDATKPFWRQGNRFKGITIGENCWLGHGVVVTDGSVIENNSIVGPNTVVRGIFKSKAKAVNEKEIKL